MKAAFALGIAIAAMAPAQTISYVASVKPNNSANPRTRTEYSPGGRFTATATNIRTLIRLAYRLQDYQVAGEPAWFSAKRYDIAAKADNDPPPAQALFLRILLQDKFHLAAHNETRTLPAFALEPAREDGRSGPQLRKSDFDCAAYIAGPHPPPEAGRVSPCSAKFNLGSLSGRSIPMSQLATTLGFFTGRFVVDKTGLAGGYDIDLTWTPDQPAAPPDDSRSAPAGPSIFTALTEQLGLKLVSVKAPVDVLVIDGAQEPAPE